MNLPRAALLTAAGTVLGVLAFVTALLTLILLFVRLDEGAAITAVMMAILMMGAVACVSARAVREWWREDAMIEDEGEIP